MSLHLTAINLLLLLILLDRPLNLLPDLLVLLQLSAPRLLLRLQLLRHLLHLVLEVLGQGLAFYFLYFQHFLVLQVEVVVFIQQVEAYFMQKLFLLEGDVHFLFHFLYVRVVLVLLDLSLAQSFLLFLDLSDGLSNAISEIPALLGISSIMMQLLNIATLFFKHFINALGFFFFTFLLVFEFI